jgi:hypothetical protein
MVPGGIGSRQIEAGGPQVKKFRVRQLGVEDQLFQVRDGGRVDKQVRGQNCDILVVKGAIIIVGAAREVIRLVGGPRLIDKLKVKFRHFREIACDTAANFLGMAVVFQVQMVCEDANLVWGADQ